MKTPVIPMCVVLILACTCQLRAYSEEDRRQYSRTRIELVDSYELPCGTAGKLAATNKGIAFLDQGSQAIVTVRNGKVVDTVVLDEGHNLQYAALAWHDGDYLLLSRSTKRIYAVSDSDQERQRRVVIDLNTVSLEGELFMETFAYDGRHVYLVVLAGFNTHIARIEANSGQVRPFAYAPGRPAALACADSSLYYMCHRSAAQSRPILTQFRKEVRGGQVFATELLDIEMPCSRSTGLAVADGFVWTCNQAHGAVTEMRLK